MEKKKGSSQIFDELSQALKWAEGENDHGEISHMRSLISNTAWCVFAADLGVIGLVDETEDGKFRAYRCSWN